MLITSHLKVAFDRQSSCRFKTWHSWLRKTQNGFYRATQKCLAFYKCPVGAFASDHTHCYNFTETNTLYCDICDQVKYNRLNNEAYAGNCLKNVFTLNFLSLSTILDSAQFLPFPVKRQEPLV